MTRWPSNLDATPEPGQVQCPTCDGYGEVAFGEPCPTCDSAGWVQEEA